jgi:hypothetical protein
MHKYSTAKNSTVVLQGYSGFWASNQPYSSKTQALKYMGSETTKKQRTGLGCGLV